MSFFTIPLDFNFVEVIVYNASPINSGVIEVIVFLKHDVADEGGELKVTCFVTNGIGQIRVHHVSVLIPETFGPTNKVCQPLK